ncbi:hypothetical protein P797_27295 [Pseudomonas aeruginosa VRFPA04]|nr:hypothetical protein P797_27295 [Pseudomonas aeruginosa VRFPA04]
MQVVEVLEALLDALGDGDRLGVGQRAVVAAGTSDDVAEQALVRRAEAGCAGLAPQRVEVLQAHVGEHQVLFVGHADLAETVALGPVGDAFHLLRGDVARRRAGAGLGRQHHRGVARHLVRLDVARGPAGEGRIGRTGAAVGQLAVGRRQVVRQYEALGDPLALLGSQLRRAVAQVLPLFLHLAGESLDAQRLDQDLDPRLVLVVAPAVAVVDPQDRLDVGQQVLPGQVVADHLAEHRRASQAAADQDPQAQLAGVGVAVKVQADVVHLHRGAVFHRRTEGDLELAREEQELRVHRRPLAQDLGQRPGVGPFVRGDPGEGFGGDIAHAVAGGLDRMHLRAGEVFEDIADLLQFDPVELDVLPRGEVPVAAVVVPGDVRQGAQLRRRQGAVGNRHAQHVGVLLQVQAVLQAQREELLLAQFAVEAAGDLVAELPTTTRWFASSPS